MKAMRCIWPPYTGQISEKTLINAGDQRGPQVVRRWAGLGLWLRLDHYTKSTSWDGNRAFCDGPVSIGICLLYTGLHAAKGTGSCTLQRTCQQCSVAGRLNQTTRCALRFLLFVCIKRP